MVTDPFYLQTHLERFRSWAKIELPLINGQIEAGYQAPATLEVALTEWIRPLPIDSADFICDRWEARQLIQLLAFGISSLEKHLRERGEPAGVVFQRIPEAEFLLAYLAEMACHPPRDSHYTYWLWNTEVPMLSFTGDPQENYFNDAVNITHHLQSVSFELLAPICEGTLSLTHPTAIEALRQAAHNTEVIYEAYRGFMSKDEQGHRRMEPDFFMKRMRTYLPTYPIQETEWSGVNAANLAVQMGMDYRIGTVKPDYRETVQARMMYLTQEDQQLIATTLELPSLADIFYQRLRIHPVQIGELSQAALKPILQSQPAALHTALSAYADLVMAAARLTSMHWALIQNYLIKPAQHLTEVERRHMAVDPHAGTGGSDHQKTAAIMHMRREHPAVWTLVRAAR